MDMLLSVGERISMALLAIALHERGHDAVSLTGSQSGVITDTRHTRARVLEVRPQRIEQELAAGRIPIVGGFQGVSTEKAITTLGRGGSDTTAVALAAALRADRCEILSDVPGVLTADPGLVPGARLLEHVAYGEMLDLAGAGARVLAEEAVELASRLGITLRLGAAVGHAVGTIVTGGGAFPEARLVGIAHQGGLVLLRVSRPRGAELPSALLAEAGLPPLHETHAGGPRGGSPTLLAYRRGDAERARGVLSAQGYTCRTLLADAARLTLVGSGLGDQCKLRREIDRALEEAGARPVASNLSPTRLTLFLSEVRAEEALRRIHARLFESGVSAPTAGSQ
jgi:aspartate kinase